MSFDLHTQISNIQLSTNQMIGKGGYGEVFKINDTTVQKIIPFTYEGFYNYSDINGQNLREAVFHSSYPKNDNLISCSKVGFDEDFNISMDMSLYETNLFEYIQFLHKEKDMEIIVSEFYCIFAQICEGLSVLHSNDMFHGDIKPSNIVINTKDKKVALIDFGGIKYEINHSTKTNCTRFYTAPELYPDYYKTNSYIKRFGIYNDVWSLGLTMLEFMTNENRNEQFSNTDDMSCFINREIKEYPVYRIMKENDVNLEDETIKPIYELICKMLIRDVNKRIYFDDLYDFFHKDKKYKLLKKDFPFFIPPQSSDRQECIYRQKLLFQNFPEYQCVFELGVSICDRYVQVNQCEYSQTLLEVSMYIATCLLTDITEKDVLTDFFPLSSYTEHMEIIISIIESLEFDLYRPTFFKYISDMGFSMNKIHRKIIFELTSSPDNVGILTHDELYPIFVNELELQKKQKEIKNKTEVIPSSVLKRKYR